MLARLDDLKQQNKLLFSKCRQLNGQYYQARKIMEQSIFGCYDEEQTRQAAFIEYQNQQLKNILQLGQISDPNIQEQMHDLEEKETQQQLMQQLQKISQKRKYNRAKVRSQESSLNITPGISPKKSYLLSSPTNKEVSLSYSFDSFNSVL